MQEVPADIRAAEVEAFEPVETVAGDEAGGLLILCDHASNALPPSYGSLGLPASQLRRHIGYDIGVADLTRDLVGRLGAPAVLSRFSRLLIDPNRGEDDPTLVMRISDGALIPANARIGRDERQARIERYYRPYHEAVAATIDRMIATGRPPAILSIHSFTPVWRGWPRPWHAGILWDRDPRLAVAMLAALRRDPALIVGDNEPYTGALKNDTMYKHGTARGLAHALLEVRQDLIAEPAGVRSWAARMEPLMRELMQIEGLNAIRHFGSKTDADSGSDSAGRSGS